MLILKKKEKCLPFLLTPQGILSCCLRREAPPPAPRFCCKHFFISTQLKKFRRFLHQTLN